ncbi:MAG TPA: hypothetical protein VN658_00800 [Candidatus Acidoferrales bacterium]|nr:hypothetical protein [Candidatus Acidoferrales bacterium]
MSDFKLKYLEMIQAAITRMAGNQVQLRTWAVTLGTLVIGYAAAKEGHPRAALLGALPAITFWIQDGYYLALEKKFRTIFDVARESQTDPPDFTMSHGKLAAADWLEGCARPAVWLAHLPVLILAFVVGIWG